MGVVEQLNFTERNAYLELKRRLDNELSPEMKNDIHLFLRFLRARDFNVDLSEAMLRNHLAWRRAIQIDSILTHFVPHEVVTKYLPFANIGHDKDGAPIRFMEFGNMDTKGILKAVKKHTLIKSILQEFEKDVVDMKEQSEKLKKPIEQWVYIFDYANFSFAKATHKETIEFLIELFMTYEANYPERLKAAYVINASVYFTIFFAVVKPFLSGATLRKLTIYGKDNWKDDLLNLYGPEVIPAYLGGQRTDPDGNPMCYTIIKHGMPVPEEYFRTKSDRRLKDQPGVKKITVSRMSKVSQVLEVNEKGSSIEWEFETECRDIGFGLYYKMPGDNKPTELVPKQRIDTNMASEVGMFLCDRVGTYILVFDNSYSWIHQKEIYCKISVVSPNNQILVKEH